MPELDGDMSYPDPMTVGARTYDRRWVLRNLHLLSGKDLCCPCAPGELCHADHLNRCANPVAA